MAKKLEIEAIHDELESVNRGRETFEAEQRAKALDLATKRNLMYREATDRRDSVAQAGIYKGQVVQVYDPDLLDAETLATLEHMGTPVPPVAEVFPDGVTIPGKGK